MISSSNSIGLLGALTVLPSITGWLSGPKLCLKCPVSAGGNVLPIRKGGEGGKLPPRVATSVFLALPLELRPKSPENLHAVAYLEYTDYNAHNGDSLKVLVEKHGVQLRKFPNELLMEIGKIAGQVVAEVGNSDPMTKKVYDSYIDFRRKMIGWGKISEQAYLNARSLPFKYA